MSNRAILAVETATGNSYDVYFSQNGADNWWLYFVLQHVSEERDLEGLQTLPTPLPEFLEEVRDAPMPDFDINIPHTDTPLVEANPRRTDVTFDDIVDQFNFLMHEALYVVEEKTHGFFPVWIHPCVLSQMVLDLRTTIYPLEYLDAKGTGEAHKIEPIYEFEGNDYEHPNAVEPNAPDTLNLSPRELLMRQHRNIFQTLRAGNVSAGEIGLVATDDVVIEVTRTQPPAHPPFPTTGVLLAWTPAPPPATGFWELKRDIGRFRWEHSSDVWQRSAQMPDDDVDFEFIDTAIADFVTMLEVDVDANVAVQSLSV